MLFNDVETGHGNLDHVLVGPAGVFVLESKRLAGKVAVRRGELSVQWPEAPEDGYVNRTIAKRARGGALTLREAVQKRGVSRWIQSVVVLWADFEQGSIENDGVGWVQGKRLASVLAARPVVVTGSALERLTEAVTAAVATLRVDGAMRQQYASRRQDDQRGSGALEERAPVA